MVNSILDRLILNTRRSSKFKLLLVTQERLGDCVYVFSKIFIFLS